MMQKRCSNQKGQMATEMILMLAIFIVSMYFVSQQFVQRGFLKTLVQGPWEQLSGMIECGMWDSPESARPYHPNNHDRHASLLGDSSL